MTSRRCTSCRHEWPIRAFRRLWWTTKRCKICRKSGPKMATLIHWLAYPFGFSEPPNGR